jgi:hypothetical protein
MPGFAWSLGAELGVVQTQGSNVMTSVDVSGWTVEADPVATRQAHDSMAVGAPESCGCSTCRNFVAGRSRAYPEAAASLFDGLGIRSDRESQLGGAIELGDGFFLYHGFFHFVGVLVDGPAALVDVRALPDKGAFTKGTVARLEFKELQPPFRLALHTKRDLADAAFGALPLVQLEFETQLPWLLDEPYE